MGINPGNWSGFASSPVSQFDIKDGPSLMKINSGDWNSEWCLSKFFQHSIFS